MNRSSFVCTLFAAVILAASIPRGALAADIKTAEAAKPKWPAKMEITTGTLTLSPTTRTVSTLGDVMVFSGQPAEADFETLKKRGVKSVINLRQPQEMQRVQFDEKAAAEKAGMTYLNVPCPMGPPSKEALNKIFDELEKAPSAPTYMHCTASIRVGFIWALFRAERQNIPMEQAIAEGKAAGMRNYPEMEPQARAYIEALEKSRAESKPAASAAPASPGTARPVNIAVSDRDAWRGRMESALETVRVPRVPWPEKIVIDPVRLGTLSQASRISNIILFSSQPAESDFALLKDYGIVSVINLRQPDEMTTLGFDEKAVAERNGMTYLNIPIVNTVPSAEELKKLFDAIDLAPRQPTLLHCASSNRVGFVWSMFCADRLRDYSSERSAISLGQDAGMRSDLLERNAREYMAGLERIRAEAGKKKIQLAFKNAPVSMIVSDMESASNGRILINGNLGKVKVNFLTPDPVTLQEALEQLTSQNGWAFWQRPDYAFEIMDEETYNATVLGIHAAGAPGA